MNAYRIALHSQVDCIEIDVSRSSDGVLFALHDRYFFLLSPHCKMVCHLPLPGYHLVQINDFN